jgi:glycosyltransferase involved in cell wall biosynthesis
MRLPVCLSIVGLVSSGSDIQLLLDRFLESELQWGAEGGWEIEIALWNIALSAMVVGRANPLRVLHYMGTNFGMTGVETFILQLCAAQKRAALQPAITMELNSREEVARAGTALGIPVHDFPSQHSGAEALPRKLATAWLRARRVRDLVERLRNVDVLHIHAVGISGLDAFVSAHIADVKAVVVTHHTTMNWFQPMRNRVSDLTFWLEKRLASRVVMPYAAAAAELVECGVPAERVAVIPFCVDEERFSGHTVSPPPGELRLVMAARMFEGKGHDHLLTALAKLRRSYPNLRLTLIGDGPTRPCIEAQIEALDLRDAVDLKGRVDHSDMPALMRAGHVVVLPSRMSGETFPLCLLEGMAMGLPAIGSRWFGIPDIIADGETGFIVEPGDADGLAAAIERFIENPSLHAETSRKAVARVRERFTASAVAHAYAEIYGKALAA